MVRIEIDYQGGLHCHAVHGPSGSAVATDAPVDNEGRGEAFSPTDLVATALGSCILTTMGIVARRRGVELAGAQVSVDKVMSADPPRRIRRLVVAVRLPLPADHPDRAMLEQTARTCPVHRSLHPDTEIPITFEWGSSPGPTDATAGS